MRRGRLCIGDYCGYPGVYHDCCSLRGFLAKTEKDEGYGGTGCGRSPVGGKDLAAIKGHLGTFVIFMAIMGRVSAAVKEVSATRLAQLMGTIQQVAGIKTLFRSFQNVGMSSE